MFLLAPKSENDRTQDTCFYLLLWNFYGIQWLVVKGEGVDNGWQKMKNGQGRHSLLGQGFPSPHTATSYHVSDHNHLYNKLLLLVKAGDMDESY